MMSIADYCCWLGSLQSICYYYLKDTACAMFYVLKNKKQWCNTYHSQDHKALFNPHPHGSSCLARTWIVKGFRPLNCWCCGELLFPFLPRGLWHLTVAVPCVWRTRVDNHGHNLRVFQLMLPDAQMLSFCRGPFVIGWFYGGGSSIYFHKINALSKIVWCPIWTIKNELIDLKSRVWIWSHPILTVLPVMWLNSIQFLYSLNNLTYCSWQIDFNNLHMLNIHRLTFKIDKHMHIVANL